jgi:hypothetical protein
MHRGVYSVGHRIVSAEGRWMGAVLAVGDDAVLSYRSAAALLRLRPTSRAAIDVTTPRRAHSRRGIDVHRTRYLPPEDVTRIRRIPCTTVARTLIDLAEILGPQDIQRVLERAEINGQFDLRALQETLERHTGHRGAARLCRALAGYDPALKFTRTEIERLFVELCRRFGLPEPAVNVPISLPEGGTAIVDALWLKERLAVETDGRETHATHAAFERDRHRDAQLMLLGFRVARFTWRQVTTDPAAVAETVRALLKLAGATRTRRRGPEPWRPASG